MGGQACVFYGAAEFSRDCDIAILCEPTNLSRLKSALEELQAESIAVPPFEADYLMRGHAVHFRCHAIGSENVRIDVMATMRGVDSFDQMWSRRTSLVDETGLAVELMSLPDLAAAKKTQRDKDWPMIRRLVEANYAQHHDAPSAEHGLWRQERRKYLWSWRSACRVTPLKRYIIAHWWHKQSRKTLRIYGNPWRMSKKLNELPIEHLGNR
jgi:hypothetical protein